MSRIDRQRLLDRRVLPAAGPEAVRAADHDQAAALVVRVAAEHLLLLLADLLVGHVGQDHAVEIAQEDGQLVAVLVVVEHVADRLGDDLELGLAGRQQRVRRGS